MNEFSRVEVVNPFKDLMENKDLVHFLKNISPHDWVEIGFHELEQ